MKLKVIKVNPVENMTIFVMDKVDRSMHMDVANRLMEYGNLYGEQVGFIEEPATLKGKSLNTLRLQMMGGEFCGNATRSLAALMVHLNMPGVIKSEDSYQVILEVSGSEDLLNCQVRRTENDHSYLSRVEMPLPTRISNSSLVFNNKPLSMIRVDFPGITHFIVEDRLVEDKEGFFQNMKAKTQNENLDAFGIMFYDTENKFLTPLVYVKATDSKFWERSCGSGTSALGVALAFKKGSHVHEYVKQPGGELEVLVHLEDGKVKSLHLDGKVSIVSEGIAFI